MRKTTLLAGVAVLVATAAMALPAAASNLYATGFEGPTFTAGAIAGQGGWQVFSASSQPGLAQVESGVALTGSQAASVSGSATGQTGPFYALNLASPGVIDVSGDIMLTTPTNGGSSWQFGVTGPGLSQFAGGIDIGANTIFAISGGFGSIGTFSYDVWHHVDIVLDYANQVFSVGLDGSTLASGLSFCGANGACNGAHVGAFGDAIFDTFGGSSNTGYLDNFSIDTVPGGVPEPASWALMIAGFGLAGASLRRRRAVTTAA